MQACAVGWELEDEGSEDHTEQGMGNMLCSPAPFQVTRSLLILQERKVTRQKAKNNRQYPKQVFLES